MKFSAIILAGGKSGRMKYNKEYLKIGGEFLVHKQIKQLKQIFDEIIVVTNNFEHYRNFDVKVVSDILIGYSPIIGLHAGLTQATNNYSYVIACDMPFIDLEYINYLKAKVNNQDAYVAQLNRFLEPFHAIYHKRIITTIESLIHQKKYGFQNMVQQLNFQIISEEELAPFISKTDLFKNINNEDDLFDIKQNKIEVYDQLLVNRLKGDSYYQIKDKLITEYPLSIYINNNYFMTLMTSPINLEFLVIGYLFSESIIKSLNEILDIKINLDEHKALVHISSPIQINNKTKITILSSACGTNQLPQDLSVIEYKQNDNYMFSKNDILNNISSFNKASLLFKETGGVHSALLKTENKEILIEDIGRHNVIDKIIGYILKNNILNQKYYINTSGRISSDIVLKCAKAQIPLIVSRSAPTTLAIHLGEIFNITIIGFARSNRMNIYTHPHRILMEAE